MEQVIDMVFVKERQPCTSAEAAKLADDYSTIGKRGNHHTNGVRLCGKQGHLSKDCRNKTPGKLNPKNKRLFCTERITKENREYKENRIPSQT